MKNKFRGLGVALVTPFTRTGEVDFEGLKRLVNDIIANGVDYIVALGTTSESPTLTEEEKQAIVATVVETVNHRVPVVMGLGGPSTYDILNKIDTTDFTGIDAVLSVTPYYNRPSQEGLYEHYKLISEHSPRPVILYNVCGRTSCNIEAETTLRIAADCPNVIGIKEASGRMGQIMKVAKHAPKNFFVTSGDDSLTLPLIAAGVDGVISVVANAFPKKMSELVTSALDGNFSAALKRHLEMLDLTQMCFKEGNPAGIKAYLALQGKIDYNLRLPLTPISNDLMHQMELALKK